jgi:hypothetical protein
MLKITAGRLSYANVTATLALVLSMSGGAVAASHYLINSTRQINPRVLKRLRGNTGPPGPPGAAAPTAQVGLVVPSGTPGARGEIGPAGTARAFGAVTAAGLMTGPSRNVAAVSKVAEGKYCIAASEPAINPSNTLIVVAFDASGTNGGNALARTHPMNCPAEQFEVDTIVYRETGTGILSEYHAEPFTFTIP